MDKNVLQVGEHGREVRKKRRIEDLNNPLHLLYLVPHLPRTGAIYQLLVLTTAPILEDYMVEARWLAFVQAGHETKSSWLERVADAVNLP